MKKNKMLRVASILLIAVLLSTSVISGTFAKYVTSDSAVDTARVAKWGVVITGSGSLFGKNYETGVIANSYPSTVTTASSLSVMSSNTSNVVAPGTQGEKQGLAFSLNGTPEVRTQIDVVVKAQDIYLAAGTYGVMKEEAVNAVQFAALKDSLYTKSDSAYTKLAGTATYSDSTHYYIIADQVTVASGGYYPVVFVNSNSNANDTKITEIARLLATNIQTSLTDADTTTAGVDYTVTVTEDPNVNLGTAVKLSDNKITWQWVFTGSDPIDKEDTILGNLAAVMLEQAIDVVAVDGTAVTVLTVDKTSGIVKSGDTEVGSTLTKFDISITATQAD